MLFRGKHLCLPEKKKVAFSQKEYRFTFKWFDSWDQGTIIHSNIWGVDDITDPIEEDVTQQFPGDLDRGTPLIVEENNKNTIAGIFRENLAQDSIKGPSVFDRLYPEIVNWIIDNSDWAVDSSCYTFTSCTCGQQAPGHTRGLSNRIIVSKNTEAEDVPSGKYPWEAIVFNAKHDYCDATAKSDLFKHAAPDGIKFDICSGSLISDRHIITSAACILQNRADMEEFTWTIAKHHFTFTKAPCLYASVGITDWVAAVNDGKILEVEARYLREEAFTETTSYNYNIGVYQNV